MLNTVPVTTPHIWGVSIKGSSCNGKIPRAVRQKVLWRCLDLYTQRRVVVASSFTLPSGEDGAVSAKDNMKHHQPKNMLQKTRNYYFTPKAVAIDFNDESADVDSEDEEDGRGNEPFYENMPILATLAAIPYDFVAKDLERLAIGHNALDEASALDDFAALATHLLSLSIIDGGITSICGLLGNCPKLKTLCLRRALSLSSLDGLQEHTHLEALDVCFCVKLTSLIELHTCPLLVTVECFGCHLLASLDGLQQHARLTQVNLASTKITSLLALQDCPALEAVNVMSCFQLTTLDGLQDHAFLRVVEANFTPISSIKELLTCPALTTVDVSHCRQLASFDGLQDHAHLSEVNAYYAVAVANLHALASCAGLETLDIGYCAAISSLDGLQNHLFLQKVMAPNTAISSLRELLSCPALRTVEVWGCQQCNWQSEDFSKNVEIIAKFRPR